MRKKPITTGIAAALAAQVLLAATAVTASDARVQVNLNPPNVPSPRPAPLKAPVGSVLYNQPGDFYSGTPSQNFQSSMDAYDSASADDFVVTDANGWDISQFNFTATASGSGDPGLATYDINIYNNAGSLPGALTSCSYSALDGTLSVPGGITQLSVALPVACHLDPGTYWVSFVANLDSSVGGQIFWNDIDPVIPPINSPGVFENPGDGFVVGCPTWGPLASCGNDTVGGGFNPIGGGGSGFIFQVLGSVTGGGGTCTSGGICLDVTLALDNGDPNQCGTADTLDASVGDQVNFCYTVTNDSGIELDYQSLMDNIDGSVFRFMPTALAPGASYQYNRVVTADTTETVTSTWTSQDIPAGYDATSTGGIGIADRLFCDGFDGIPCDSGGGSDFIDITGSGTALSLLDDESVGVTLPFSFNFYGQTSSDICIANNAYLLFDTTTCPVNDGLYYNFALPDGDFRTPAILPLWDDFAFYQSGASGVYYATRGTAPNRQFIVEWFDRVHILASSNTDAATFEVILNESGTIQFEYDDVAYTAFNNLSGDPNDCTDGVCATIGLQQSGTLADQYSFNTASISDDSGIDWTPNSPTIFTDTDTVTLNVGAPVIDVTPNPLSGTAPAGGTSTAELDIGNTGNRDLNWNLVEAPPASHFPPPGMRFALPLGDPSNTTIEADSRFPVRNPGQKPARMQMSFGSTATVPTFGMDILNANFVSYDAAAPSTVNVIGSNDYQLFAGDFINDDFSTLYAFDGITFSHANEYVAVDTATGAVTDIANVPPTNGGVWTGMSWDSTTDTLYASAVETCGINSAIYTIDPATGAATLVGTNTAPCLIDIAVSPDGLLYGLDIADDALYAIDKATGEASLIGSIGFNANAAQSMDFDDSTGILYLAGDDGDTGVDASYTVNTETGRATIIGPIGSVHGEIDAMAIATAGGPCAQPQDLPWLSLSPTSGTTAPGGSEAVTVTFDATGQAQGDVLDGTICVHSNDTTDRVVAVPVELTVGAGGGGGGGIVDSGPIDVPIPTDFTGLFVNWLSGCVSTAGCPNGADFNPFGMTLAYLWFGPNGSICVSTDGSACDDLGSGDTIGPAAAYAAGTPSQTAYAGGTFLMGFSFTNADTGVTNYSYARITTTGPEGTPATLNEYYYDNTGAPITIP